LLDGLGMIDGDAVGGAPTILKVGFLALPEDAEF
jgi:hypothetical protein